MKTSSSADTRTNLDAVAAPTDEVDKTALDHNLSLSIEQRIANHERARHLVIELQAAGAASYAEHKSR